MRPKERIKPFLKYIEKLWVESPNQRFGQLLINNGIVEDGTFNWNAEIHNYDIPHEYIREIQHWGKINWYRNYKQILIKDLEFDHIIAILETQKHISDNLRTILEVELSWRLSNP